MWAVIIALSVFTVITGAFLTAAFVIDTKARKRRDQKVNDGVEEIELTEEDWHHFIMFKFFPLDRK